MSVLGRCLSYEMSVIRGFTVPDLLECLGHLVSNNCVLDDSGKLDGNIFLPQALTSRLTMLINVDKFESMVKFGFRGQFFIYC